MQVITLSTTDNAHAKAVCQKVLDRGVAVAAFHFDSPDRRAISFSFPSEAGQWLAQAKINPAEVAGVFVHHPLPQNLSFCGTDALDGSLIAAGWRNALDWFEDTFKGAVWLNAPSAARNSAPIARQLQVAAGRGLRVPETLFTNDIDRLRDFAKRHSKIVLKPGPLRGVNLAGGRILTRLIDIKDVNEAQLQAAPCYFQEYIEKSHELRVHVINNEVLTCRIDSQACEQTRIDWRNYRLSETPHTPFSVDENLASICRAITRDLSLAFGILDLVVTPSGEPVFLEANAQGHWLWIEELTKLPITASIARALCARA